MDGPSKLMSTPGTNGLPAIASSLGSQGSDGPRSGAITHEKRHSIAANPPLASSGNTLLQKPRNDPASAKRSGFNLFNKFKDDDDERELLKRLKAENKQLRAEFKDLQIKSNLIGAENERFKNNMVGERRINRQLQPDAHYSSALERIFVGLTDWTVTHFRGKNTRPYTPEMVEEIRAGLKKLSDANNLIPSSLLWTEVDLAKALQDSKFRIAFVLHVIGLYLHEKVFSPFAYEIEDFGLSYWLKRISDEVARSGKRPCIFENCLLICIPEDRDFYYKWDWYRTLFGTMPSMFDGAAVQARIVRRIARILRQIHPREHPEDAIFEKLQDYTNDAFAIAVEMRLEQDRFVSLFPTQGASFQTARHSTGGEEQSGLIRICTFPGIIKQTMFLGVSAVDDVSIFKARVHLNSTFQHLDLGPIVAVQEEGLAAVPSQTLKES
jgi:hypothetical protein